VLPWRYVPTKRQSFLLEPHGVIPEDEILNRKMHCQFSVSDRFFRDPARSKIVQTRNKSSVRSSGFAFDCPMPCPLSVSMTVTLSA
jgi:hypothetical protein